VTDTYDWRFSFLEAIRSARAMPVITLPRTDSEIGADPNTSPAELLRLSAEVPEAVASNPALDLLSAEQPAVWEAILATVRFRRAERATARLVRAASWREERHLAFLCAELASPIIPEPEQRVLVELAVGFGTRWADGEREACGLMRRCKRRIRLYKAPAQSLNAALSAVSAALDTGSTFSVVPAWNGLSCAVQHLATEQGRSPRLAAAETSEELLRRFEAVVGAGR
jgi:hypothetical protein